MTARHAIALSTVTLTLGGLAGAAASADTTPPPLWGPGAATTTTTATTTAPSPPATTGTNPAPPTNPAAPTSTAAREADGKRLDFTTPHYRGARAYLPVACRRVGKRRIPCRVDVEMRFDNRGRPLRRRLRLGAGKSSAIVLAMSTRRYCAIHTIDVETFVVGTDLRTSVREVGMADARPVCA